MDYIAEITEGFSGADLAELFQRAAKAAVREAIEADAQKKALTENKEIPKFLVSKFFSLRKI